MELLKKSWFVTKEELQEFENKRKIDLEFSEFKSEFSTILNEKQTNAVFELKTKLFPDKNLQEIAKEYWFIDDAMLEKAKGYRYIPGNW
jgi:hypothetical protein